MFINATLGRGDIVVRAGRHSIVWAVKNGMVVVLPIQAIGDSEPKRRGDVAFDNWQIAAQLGLACAAERNRKPA